MTTQKGTVMIDHGNSRITLQASGVNTPPLLNSGGTENAMQQFT